MSPREPRWDQARPIPQTGRRPDPPPPQQQEQEDDVVVVDTRKSFSLRGSGAGAPRTRPAARQARAGPEGQGAAAYEGLRPGPGARPVPPRGAGQVPPPGARPVPPRGGGPVPAQASAAVGPRRPSRAVRVRRVVALVAVLAVLWVGFLVWVPYRAWSTVQRVDHAPASRPADSSGRNYLLVGSDSRAGVTTQQAQTYGVDTEDAGQHTDTIMLVHVSERGNPPVVLSIPRDSYVTIPGKGQNKINAAYTLGGARLLTNTVETLTGIRIDGFLEVGLIGFATIVDSLGGVEICVPFDMKDEHSGIDVKAGCQQMDGKTSLQYVRTRYADPRGDLGRAERQRQFLGAVMKKAVTPATAVDPGRYRAVADAVSTGLVVGETTTLTDAWRVLQALRSVGNGEGVSMQVPVENPSYLTKNAGSAVKLHDAQAKVLFTALKNDESVSAPPAR